VLQPSFRQTIFLPVVGLVDADTMKPGDLVGVNKDSYLILDTLPSEYDSRVKAMEVRLTLHTRFACAIGMTLLPCARYSAQTCQGLRSESQTYHCHTVDWPIARMLSNMHLGQ